METLRKIGLLFAAVLVAMSMTACGGDDDDKDNDGPDAPSSADCYFAFEGKNYEVDHGYISYDDNYVDIMCFDRDIYDAMKGTYNMFSIGFLKPSGWDNGGTFTLTDYDVYGGIGLKAADEYAGVYFDEVHDSGNPALTIKRSGSNYEISVSNVEVESEDGVSDIHRVSFNYSGKIKDNPIEVE